jgi:hypothetical protein
MCMGWQQMFGALRNFWRRSLHRARSCEHSPMYERFTDRAREVVALAEQEARRFNHEYIGTEHFCLGSLRRRPALRPTCSKA